MYDELEVNKGRFKNCNFDEGIFKNINAISNSKVVNSSMNDCIFEQVNFYKTSSKISFENTTFDETTINNTTFQDVVFDGNTFSDVKITDTVFKNVVLKR